MSSIHHPYLILFILVTILSGCGGGSSSSGLGLSVGGSWKGTLFRNQLAITNFTMSFSQTADDPNDPFSNDSISGVFNSNHNCIGGGTLEGTLVANGINLSANTSNGTLNLGGQASNTSMSGTWTNSGSVTNGADNTACNFGGTWVAHR